MPSEREKNGARNKVKEERRWESDKWKSRLLCHFKTQKLSWNFAFCACLKFGSWYILHLDVKCLTDKQCFEQFWLFRSQAVTGKWLNLLHKANFFFAKIPGVNGWSCKWIHHKEGSVAICKLNKHQTYTGHVTCYSLGIILHHCCGYESWCKG